MSYYICKVVFSTDEVNKVTNQAKQIRSEFAVEATSTLDAETKLAGYLKGTVSDYELVSIIKSKIEAVIT